MSPTYKIIHGCSFMVEPDDNGNDKIVFDPNLVERNSALEIDDLDINKDGIDHYNISFVSKITRHRYLSWNKKVLINTIIGSVISMARAYDYITSKGYPYEWLSDTSLDDKEIYKKTRGLEKVRQPYNFIALLTYLTCQRFYNHRSLLKDLKDLDPNFPMTIYVVRKVQTLNETEQLEVSFCNDIRAKYISILKIIKALEHLGMFNVETIQELTVALMKFKNLHILTGLANLDHPVFDKYRDEITEKLELYRKNSPSVQRRQAAKSNKGSLSDLSKLFKGEVRVASTPEVHDTGTPASGT